MEHSNEPSLLQLLKEKSNILNAKCQQFQADIKCITDDIMSEIENENKSKFNNKINKLCNDYSAAINRLEIEYLIKCEPYLQTTNSNNSSPDPPSINPPESSTKPISYTCFDCNISYTAKSSLLRHNRKNHNFSQEPDSSTSETETQPQQKHKCNKCDKICSSIYCLRQHTKKEHSHNTIQCNICFKTFASKQALGGHISGAHRKSRSRPFKCGQCPSGFALKRYLRQHLINVHNEDPWQCDECNQTFRFKKQLMQHKKTTHANNTSESSGGDDILLVRDGEDNDECNEPFTQQREQHGVNKHAFGCNECDEKFANGMELNRHRNTVHVIMNANPYKCDICCKLYASVTGLKVHKLTHNQAQIFKCRVEECHSTFELERYLTRHMINYHKQNAWKCGYDGCEQSFRKKMDMVTHQTTMHESVSDDRKEINESSESEKESVVNDEGMYKRTKSLFNHRL